MDFLARFASCAGGFAARVLDLVFPPKSTALIARSATESGVRALAAPVRMSVGGMDAVALARFRAPLMRALVHEAKFNANRRAQEMLGTLLANYFANDLHDAVLVPIPLSDARRRERGFNQCEAIAQAALALLDQKENTVPSIGLAEATRPRPQIRLAPELLQRVRDTGHQTALTRAGRQANVVGAFSVPAARRPLDTDALYIVFDDVLTTGATIGEAGAALRAAGAKRLLLLALAN